MVCLLGVWCADMSETRHGSPSQESAKTLSVPCCKPKSYPGVRREPVLRRCVYQIVGWYRFLALFPSCVPAIEQWRKTEICVPGDHGYGVFEWKYRCKGCNSQIKEKRCGLRGKASCDTMYLRNAPRRTNFTFGASLVPNPDSLMLRTGVPLAWRSALESSTSSHQARRK